MDWAFLFLGLGVLALIVLWFGFGINPFRLIHAGMTGNADAMFPAAPAPTPRPVPTPIIAPAEPTPAPLALRAWLNKVNHQPDKTPQCAASGPSGSGKTTLILAALHDRPGRFVIVTPKSQRADPWGGLPVIRLRPHDMSFAPIEQAINAVYAEMLRRNAQDADVDDDWLTLVIDEFSTVIGKLPDLREKVLDMVTLGRSSRIRIIILATETNVKAWGWEGRGEARHNVLFIECEEETHKAVVYRWGKEKQSIDTSLLPQIAARPLSHTRWWTPPNDGLSALDLPGFGTVDQTDGLQTAQTVPSERVLMRKYRRVGLSREQARRLFQEDGLGFNNNLWAEVGRELEEGAIAA